MQLSKVYAVELAKYQYFKMIIQMVVLTENKIDGPMFVKVS